MKDQKNFGLWYRKLIISLNSAPTRTCQSLHECRLCGQPITLGEQYRDRGYGRRAHLKCLQREDL